jgi:hypothetical protein
MFKAIKTEDDMKVEAMRAPPLIELADNEKFVDADGNRLDIEVRGTKSINDIYFNVKDVGDRFKIGDVRNTLVHPDSKFLLDVHYRLFKRKRGETVGKPSNKKAQKSLFLTFRGLTRLLYVSHSKHAEHFQDWANKLLFTAQMGTREEKRILFDKILGYDAKIASDVIGRGVSIISCIYLFTLGYVKDLRDTMTIDPRFGDDEIVCKYGRTNNLMRRSGEHMLAFSKIAGVDLRLRCYVYVDNQYTPEAEGEVKQYFKALGANIVYQTSEELVSVKSEQLVRIEELYQNIGNKYMVDNNEMIAALKHKDYEIRELKQINEKQALVLEIAQKDHEMYKKDREIQMLRMQLEHMKPH